MLKNTFVIIFCFMFSSFFYAQEQDNSNNIQLKINEVQLDSLMDLKDNEVLIAEIQTVMGTIEIEFFHKLAPKTVKNFVGLATSGYYNGVIFHRVIDRFMIQGGDPTGTGMGGSSIYGETFEDEFDASLRYDRPGLLAMANRGPNTNGSQFFITLVPTPHLNDRHTIFGEVKKGFDVVQAIGKVAVSPDRNKPFVDVVINNINIIKVSK
ncbi:MAG TPA: peptidylprolyl isomerase [Melioribacteraceae bacterium]|nr:peptidylprolyl isomerase [Melioribacteraceae bacterium]